MKDNPAWIAAILASIPPAGIVANTEYPIRIGETEAVPPPDPTLPLDFSTAATPRPRKGSFHRPGFDEKAFWEKVEHRRKKNKVARKARRKNKK
jgi:hypothetical protein